MKYVAAKELAVKLFVMCGRGKYSDNTGINTFYFIDY